GLPAESFTDPVRDIGEASIEAERAQWRMHDATHEIRVPKPGHGEGLQMDDWSSTPATGTGIDVRKANDRRRACCSHPNERKFFRAVVAQFTREDEGTSLSDHDEAVVATKFPGRADNHGFEKSKRSDDARRDVAAGGKWDARGVFGALPADSSSCVR